VIKKGKRFLERKKTKKIRGAGFTLEKRGKNPLKPGGTKNERREIDIH